VRLPACHRGALGKAAGSRSPVRWTEAFPVVAVWENLIQRNIDCYFGKPIGVFGSKKPAEIPNTLRTVTGYEKIIREQPVVAGFCCQAANDFNVTNPGFATQAGLISGIRAVGTVWLKAEPVALHPIKRVIVSEVRKTKLRECSLAFPEVEESCGRLFPAADNRRVYVWDDPLHSRCVEPVHAAPERIDLAEDICRDTARVGIPSAEASGGAPDGVEGNVMSVV
jgi:hypothetical protein